MWYWYQTSHLTLYIPGIIKMLCYLGLEEEADDALWASVCRSVRGHADWHRLTVSPGSGRVHLLCSAHHCQGQTYNRKQEDLMFVSKHLSLPAASLFVVIYFVPTAVLLMNYLLWQRWWHSGKAEVLIRVSVLTQSMLAQPAWFNMAGCHWNISTLCSDALYCEVKCYVTK